MKKVSKFLSLMLVAVTATAMVSCGNKDSSKSSNNNVEILDKKEIKGTVDYAIPTNWLEGKQPIIDSFKDAFPNVTVNVINYDSDPDTFLSSQAASGDLPGVVEGWTSIIYPLSQGWVKPLNEFIKNDPDIKNIPEALLNQFVIDNKTYALPYRIPLQGILVNLDLLNQLNLDHPGYEISVDDFITYCKKATTDKYSGVTSLSAFEAYMVTKYDKDLTEWGYNKETGKFDFTNGALEQAVNFVKSLNEVPGLVADSLKNQALKEEGKSDDYERKFGKEVDAFEDGKVLFKLTGSWAFDNLGLNFDYDYIPYPTDPSVGYKQNVGYDFIYMTTAVEESNEKATFEFLKWLTYSEEGTLSFIEARESQENPIPKVYIPAIHTDKVAEKIENSDYVDGIKFMYENLDKSTVGCSKIAPGYSSITSEVIVPKINEALKGEVDISSVVKEMEDRANSILDESWDKLRKDISEAYAK